MNKTNRNKSVYLALFAVFCFALNPSIALSFTGQLPLKAEDGSISITVPTCTDDTKALHFSGNTFTCADIAVGTSAIISIAGTSPINATTASGATTISLSTAGTWLGNAATVDTNANLTGDVTSTGNATVIAPGVIVNTDINANAAIAYSKMEASGNAPIWNQDTTGNAKASATVFFTTQTKLSTGLGDLYASLSGVLSGSETDVQVPIPQGIYKNLKCRASAAPGAATTVSFGTNTCGSAASTGQIAVAIPATGVAAIANTSTTRSITTDDQCGAIKIVKLAGYATSGYISCSIERH